MAKIAAFLIPLAVWATICFFWVPEVVVTEQNDGSYHHNDRVPRAKFDADKAEVQSRPPMFRCSDQAMQAMPAAGVPTPVIAQLRSSFGPNPARGLPKGFGWKDKPEFKKEIRFDDDLKAYLDPIWNSFEKDPPKPSEGDPSTPIWLPPPHKVAMAFYKAFVTPPNGAGYRFSHDSLEALRDDIIPKAARTKDQAIRALTAWSMLIQSRSLPFGALGIGAPLWDVVGSLALVDRPLTPTDTVDKLDSLPKDFFAYGDRDRFLGTIATVLDPDELDRNQSKILRHAYVRTDPWLHESLWHSCQIIFWGFIISAIIGVPLGVLCGTFDLFSKLTEPFVDFIRYMPAPAFGVLVVAILGISDGPKIAIIWIGTFFQMVLVVANTTRQFDESLLEAAQTLGASKRSLLTKVILPGILPSLYNDMRILLGWAWTYLIVAELIGASSGISFFIAQQGRFRRFENVYAGIIMIGLIGLLCDQFLAAMAKYLFPWVPRKEGSGAWAAFFAAIAAMFGKGKKVELPAKQAA
jgi:ABC-type nitrate/sulfonate/bicarbonate transport system permease component